MSDDTETFERHRPALLAHAYRLLGDLARAEDMVQETWVRWQSRQVDVAVEEPRAFLVTIVTHLCLDELGSARARREESRSDRLPEPVDLSQSALERVEMSDQISMAFLVLLQRLTPLERAVFLLHDVFEMSHNDIATLLGKSDAACRQILSRAHASVAAERPPHQTAREDHRRLLLAFLRAATSGEQDALLELIADDAVLIADGGEDGVRYGRTRSAGRPVLGRTKIIAAMKSFARQDVTPHAEYRERILNNEPAVVTFRDGKAVAAVFVAVADDKIRKIFIQLDVERLQHVGPMT